MANATGTGRRVGVVTGGSRGIGRETAARLGKDRYDVVVAYAGNADAAKESVAAVEKAGGRGLAVQADVADEEAVQALFEQAEAAFGGVDVVVNAAGISVLSPVVDLDLTDLDRVLRTNLRGAFVVAQRALRRLRAGGTLLLFSTSQVNVGLAFPRYSPYVASKAGVEAMTMILAREMRGRDVTVNTVSPGPTSTEFLTDVNDEQALSRLASAPPLERLGTPADIAEVVAFLASPAGHWVNGQVVRANGGII